MDLFFLRRPNISQDWLIFGGRGLHGRGVVMVLGELMATVRRLGYTAADPDRDVHSYTYKKIFLWGRDHTTPVPVVVVAAVVPCRCSFACVHDSRYSATYSGEAAAAVAPGARLHGTAVGRTHNECGSPFAAGEVGAASSGPGRRTDGCGNPRYRCTDRDDPATRETGEHSSSKPGVQ